MADDTLFDNLGRILLPELIGFFVGECIGAGSYRRVYDLPLLPGFVLKAELSNSGFFCNVEEWGLWNQFNEDSHVGPWLAPCKAISACGTFLIQAKTTPIDRLPDLVPAFLADYKRENFGMYEGRVVCHDYGNNDMRRPSKRMRKRSDVMNSRAGDAVVRAREAELALG